jgi:hypothetical protein
MKKRADDSSDGVAAHSSSDYLSANHKKEKYMYKLNSSTFWKRAMASCILALSCATAPAFADIGLTGFMYMHSNGYGEWLVYDDVLGVTWKGNTGSSGDFGYTSYIVSTATWADRPAGSWHMGTLDYVDSVHDRICGAENTACNNVWSTAF